MVKDFRLALIHPQGQQIYTSGSVVSGTLSFTLDEAKSYKLIQVGLHGVSHVHWTESRTTGSGNNQRTETVSYTSNETIVNLAVVLWSQEQSPTGKIGPGSYDFSFQINLPQRCPPSFQGSVGHIRYLVQGQIKTGAFKFDHRVEAPIQVSQVVDINQPQLLGPVRQTKKKQVGCLCCVSGDIELSAEIPRTGYCMNGDTVPLNNVTVENGSSRTITIRASIIKHVRYYAQGHQRASANTVALVASRPIQPRTTTAVELPVLQVPMTDTTISDVSNIKLYYELQVTAVIPWALNSSVIFPILVGNVPYRQGTTGVQFGAQPQPDAFGVPLATAPYPPPNPVPSNAVAPIGFAPDTAYPPPPPYEKSGF